MRVLVTGATGFVGRHTVNALLQRDHSVFAVVRDRKKFNMMEWSRQVEPLICDLHCDFSSIIQIISHMDVLVHLAWPGLPNYNDLFHVEKNLPADLNFLTAVRSAGLTHILVAGTCLEYGMQSGPLTEEMETHPTTPYGLAKDTLRKSLEMLKTKSPFSLQWVRLFYTYGVGQNRNSLLAQLETAIKENKADFDMSLGEQLRDYLSIEKIAGHIATLIEKPDCSGIINCCSGNPVSVRRLVEEYCSKRKSNLRLNLGVYPYPEYEPIAFWGVPRKLTELCPSILD